MPSTPNPLYPYPDTGVGWLDKLFQGMQKDPYSIMPGQAGVVLNPGHPEFQFLKQYAPKVAAALERMRAPIQYFNFSQPSKALGTTNPFIAEEGMQGYRLGILNKQDPVTRLETHVHEALHALYDANRPASRIPTSGPNVHEGATVGHAPPPLVPRGEFSPRAAANLLDSSLGKNLPTNEIAKLFEYYMYDPKHLAIELMGRKAVQRLPKPTMNPGESSSFMDTIKQLMGF